MRDESQAVASSVKQVSLWNARGAYLNYLGQETPVFDHISLKKTGEVLIINRGGANFTHHPAILFFGGSKRCSMENDGPLLTTIP